VNRQIRLVNFNGVYHAHAFTAAQFIAFRFIADRAGTGIFVDKKNVSRAQGNTRSAAGA